MTTAEPHARMTIRLPQALLERVDRVGARSRSAAVRILLEKGLAQDRERTEEIEIDFSDEEWARVEPRLEAWCAVNSGGDYGDAIRWLWKQAGGTGCRSEIAPPRRAPALMPATPARAVRPRTRARRQVTGALETLWSLQLPRDAEL